MKKLIFVCTIFLMMMLLSSAWAADRYDDYGELLADQTYQENVDYRIRTQQTDSDIIIHAIHGGLIDNNTDQIAKAIAGTEYNLYIFEDHIDSDDDNDTSDDDLHITGSHFDEPRGQKMTANQNIVVSIHGMRNRSTHPDIFLGGDNIKVRNIVYEELQDAGFDVGVATEEGQSLSGTHDANIVNEGRNHAGVHIELEIDIRKEMFTDYGDYNSGTTETFDRFVEAVRKALVKASGHKHPEGYVREFDIDPFESDVWLTDGLEFLDTGSFLLINEGVFVNDADLNYGYGQLEADGSFTRTKYDGLRIEIYSDTDQLVYTSGSLYENPGNNFRKIRLDIGRVIPHPGYYKIKLVHLNNDETSINTYVYGELHPYNQRFSDIANSHHIKDEDYEINVQMTDDDVLIMGLHGGEIVQGTSELVKAIAGTQHHYYLFEGTVTDDHETEQRRNHYLYLHPTLFDEMTALKMAAQANKIVSVTGMNSEEDDETVYLNGGNPHLLNEIAGALTQAGFDVSTDDPVHAPEKDSADHIVNKSRILAGVEIVLTEELRDEFFADLDERTSPTPKFDLFVDAVQSAIDRSESHPGMDMVEFDIDPFDSEVQIHDTHFLDEDSSLILNEGSQQYQQAYHGFDIELFQYECVEDTCEWVKAADEHAFWNKGMNSRHVEYPIGQLIPEPGHYIIKLTNLNPGESSWIYGGVVR